METFWSRVRMFDRWSRSRISPLSKTITNERATKRLSDHLTHNYRRTYNDWFTWKGETKKVLALSWRDVTITAMKTAFVSPFWIRIEGKTRHKKDSTFLFFPHICRFGRNIQLLLATVTWAFLAKIVNGQNYSIVVHRNGGIDKVSLQILVG